MRARFSMCILLLLLLVVGFLVWRAPIVFSYMEKRSDEARIPGYAADIEEYAAPVFGPDPAPQAFIRLCRFGSADTVRAALLSNPDILTQTSAALTQKGQGNLLHRLALGVKDPTVFTLIADALQQSALQPTSMLDASKRTPLHVAAMFNSDPVALLALRYTFGLDVEYKDGQGHTPLEALMLTGGGTPQRLTVEDIQQGENYGFTTRRGDGSEKIIKANDLVRTQEARRYAATLMYALAVANETGITGWEEGMQDALPVHLAALKLRHPLELDLMRAGFVWDQFEPASGTGAALATMRCLMDASSPLLLEGLSHLMYAVQNAHTAEGRASLYMGSLLVAKHGNHGLRLPILAAQRFPRRMEGLAKPPEMRSEEYGGMLPRRFSGGLIAIGDVDAPKTEKETLYRLLAKAGLLWDTGAGCPAADYHIGQSSYNADRLDYALALIRETPDTEETRDWAVQTVYSLFSRKPTDHLAAGGILATLLERYPALVAHRHTRHSTLLHDAAHNTSPQYVRILLEAGADPNARDDRGETPLHKAVSFFAQQYPDSVKKNITQILEAGAEINAVCHEGNTPLHEAVRRMEGGDNEAKRSILTLMLEHGANPSARNQTGHTPLEYRKRTWAFSEEDAVNNATYQAIRQLLETAAHNGTR